MHMADALVAPAVAATMYAASAAAGGYSLKKTGLEQDSRKIPVMGVMGAFVFAAQMMNFSIPGTGSSGHICGGVLLAAILGPYEAFITMISILIIQALMFADGGILALGCNIWNMAFYSCFLGYFCIYRPILRKGYSAKKIVIASVIANIVSLQFGAFSVVIETMLSGITDLPFSVFVTSMQPIHLAIGTVEGLVTGAVLVFIYRTRPELLDKNIADKRIDYRRFIIVFAAAALVTAGGLSLLASSHPDGLEWSIAKTTGDEEIQAEGTAYSTAENIQGITALFPDYSLGEDVGDEGSAKALTGNSVAGMTGTAVVAVVCIGGSYVFRKRRRRDIVTE